MKVSVVIPNYNGKKFLDDCMEALSKQTMKEFEVIIVDNGSTDGSQAYIKEKFPSVVLIELQENTGFSGAVNVGIKAAKAKYVLLLNNDTKVFPDFVKQLYDAIRGNKRIFSVSGQMIKMYQPEQYDGTGDFYSLIGWAFARGAGKSAKDHQYGARIFTSCAGAAIYRKSTFEKMGYFDEDFFAYREDIDVGYRARIYGYANRYCEKAKVYHVGSGTSGSTHNAFKVKLGVRNNIYLNYKNMPFFFLLCNLPFLAVGYIGKWIYFKKKGFGKEYKEGLLEGLRTCRSLDKVPFKWKHLPNYIAIQFYLLWGLVLGIKEM